jgi:hypothetical protein
MKLNASDETRTQRTQPTAGRVSLGGISVHRVQIPLSLTLTSAQAWFGRGVTDVPLGISQRVRFAQVTNAVVSSYWGEACSACPRQRAMECVGPAGRSQLSLGYGPMATSSLAHARTPVWGGVGSGLLQHSDLQSQTQQGLLFTDAHGAGYTRCRYDASGL